MKVAIVHDDLVQWGGAERVLEGLCEIYPDAPIYTSVFDCSNEQLLTRFGSKDVRTSFLQKIPGWKSIYKALLPLYPAAFEQFVFDDFDLVISNTTRFAKSIITKPRTIHICYCHTPPRFLWHFSGEGGYGIGELLMAKLRIYDQVSANRVDFFLAGSENAKRRIKRVYRVSSKVIHPFVDLRRFKNINTFDGGYFVVISRLNKYKKADLAVEACIKLGVPLKVIGVGPQMSNLTPYNLNLTSNVEFLGNVDDEVVVLVLAGCRALIIPGIEDFGLTSLETQALGKPVIAYQEGGALETVKDGVTGLFFEKPTVQNLKEAIIQLNSLTSFDREECIKNAKNFSKDQFSKKFQAVVASLVYSI